MGTYSIGGTQYRYLRNDNLCTVLADYPDRRMVRIRMQNGLELDEVNYHDVVPVEVAHIPDEAPAPTVPTTETAPTADAVEEQPRPRSRGRWGTPDAN